MSISVRCSFATAEEAALCVAWSPEGQAATAAARVPPLVSEEEGKGAMPSGAVLKEEGAVPPMPLGAVVKEEEVAPPMPSAACCKEEDVVPTMAPPDAVCASQGVIFCLREWPLLSSALEYKSTFTAGLW